MKKEEDQGGGLARFSIDRQISVIVLLAAALVVGAVATRSIGIELFPQGYDEPFLSVRAPWPDATPREVLDKIIVPIEDEVGTVRGLERVISVSRVGSGSVYCWFKQGTDMDIAYRELRDRVERARREFPDEVDRVFIRKDDTSGIPVSVLGVALDPAITDHYTVLKKQVVDRLERIDGVASVNVNGLQEKEILIELDRDRTAASGLNIFDLSRELGADSFTMASGPVQQGGRKLLLRSVARYDDIEALKARPVGTGVRLGDISEITYAEPEKLFRVRAMSKPAYAVVVMKEGEANAMDVSRRVKEEFELITARLEVGTETETITLFNQGEMIGESLRILLASGAIGGMLAALVLFFFLRRLRLTLVVTLAVPLSLLIALTVMYFSGETLNILSLLALMVSIGLLVDNSVVVAENIERLHRLGLRRRAAALRGSSEIGLAILMSTLTTVVVFLPVALVDSRMQFFLLRMAIPICVSILASLVVALVLVPLAVYLTLPEGGPEGGRGQHPRMERISSFMGRSYELTFGTMNRHYSSLLDRALHNRFASVMVIFLLFVFTGGAMKAASLGMVDVQEDEKGGFEIDIEMPDNYTLEEAEEWFLRAEAIVEEHAEEFGLEGWFLFHSDRGGELQGWFQNPRTVDISPRELTEKVLAMLPQRPGMEFITGDDTMHDGDEDEGVYRVPLTGEDPRALDLAVEQLAGVLEGVPGVVGRRKDKESVPNEMGLVVDRTRASRYGVNPQAVAGVVGSALRGYPLPRWRNDGREIPVRVRFREEDRDHLDALAAFRVPTMNGGSLPVSALTTPRMLDAPEYIVRRDKRISRTLALDLVEGDEDATRKRLNFLLARSQLPEGVSLSTALANRSFNEDLKQMNLALLLSVVFIYLLMGILFESFMLPLSIVFTIPLAGLGVVWIHILNGMDIDFLGAVGMVILVGVVVNNGIVLVDTINRRRREGMERSEAIAAAAAQRFRPILMTAITTIGGMVPLALNGRMDSGLSYTSFAYTLIGGMSTATLLTLLVVPVLYSYFDDAAQHFSSTVAAGRRVGASIFRLRPLSRSKG